MYINTSKRKYLSITIVTKSEFNECEQQYKLHSFVTTNIHLATSLSLTQPNKGSNLYK